MPARRGEVLASAPRQAHLLHTTLFVPFIGMTKRCVGQTTPSVKGSTIQHRDKKNLRGLSVRASSSNGSNGNGASSNANISSGSDIENVVIIGSGPAGYTAAIYAARANLRPLVFEGYQAGGVRGGQLMTTTEVENFPGFPDGITGPDLMDRMRQQAERWGSNLLLEDVTNVDLKQRPFVITGTETTARAHSIIVATGATAKRLGIPSEATFWSNGISACAICDGASPLFKGQELAVVGGGDTATEEAIYLTKYGKHIHLLVRGPRLRASMAMQDRVLSNPRITVHYNTIIEDAFGGKKGSMAGLHLVDTSSGEKRDLAVKGLFYGIGHQPNSGFLDGQLQLDDAGYVVVHGGAKTSVEGVFSAGDLHDIEWRQAVTAAGSGCMAALSAERYLTANGLLQEESAVPAKEAKVPVNVPVGAAAREAASASTSPSSSRSSHGHGASTSSSGSAVSMEEEFNLYADKHRGQFALRKLNWNCKIIFDKTKPDGTPRKIIDSSVALKYGWSPKVNLDKGLDLTLKSLPFKS